MTDHMGREIIGYAVEDSDGFEREFSTLKAADRWHGKRQFPEDYRVMRLVNCGGYIGSVPVPPGANR